MTDNKFTWVETHKQITQFLSKKESSQKELIDLLKQVGIGPFNDKTDEGGHDIELEEIDPFTFFCYIYKYGADKRLKNLQEIAKTLNISIPSDELGVPSAQPQKVWLFPYKYARINNEIQRLWDFFKKAITDNISDSAFEDVLKIKGVGKTKLTEALFYINPEKFLPIDSPTEPYIKEKLEIDPSFNNYTEYIALLEKIKSKSDLPFYEMSYDAWKWNEKNKKINYWIFQGNPKLFDFEKALKENILISWTVSSHKDKIKVGDKVILWITGSKSGCYALAEVTSEPHQKAASPDDYLWKENDKNNFKSDIKITHNLVDTPILKEDISDIEELKDLKIGNQGTNFTATQKEYEALLDWALPKDTGKIQYWIYAPGENARHWDEFYEKGIMGLGWDEIGDLKQYKSKDELKQALDKAYGGENSKKNDVLANYDFLNKLKIGDIVISKKGINELLGYGIVKSDYEYDDQRPEYKKIRKVEWKLKGSWQIGFKLVVKTLTDITNYKTEHPDYNTYYERLLGIMGLKNISKDVSEDLPSTEEAINFPLNTILYGPPGTGKTYNTILRAAEIIENRRIDSYKNALEIFNANLYNRIEFVTFHQNYSYEDFIQGLRPDVEAKGQLSFDKRDGIFTRIATDALFEFYKMSKKLEATHKENNESVDPNEIYLDFVEHLKSLESKDFKSATGSTITIISFTKSGNIEFKHANKSRIYLVSGNRLLKLFGVFPDIKKIKNIHTDIRDAIGGCNTTVYWVALKEFISFYNNYEKASDEEKEESFEEVSYESKKKLLATFDLNQLRVISSNDVPNYVIIIDEINRANISRVFGELITLIEPDKRSHGKIGLSCTLPSGDAFIVPSNLYIIGTMNTADKSIALLDIALRRRFDFEAMYPKYEIKGEKIYDVEILKQINERIIKTKGYDFQIGHAYFMGENNDLVQRMNKKVIPLLLEYYMNDEKEVKEILQSADLKIEEKSFPLRITGKND